MVWNIITPLLITGIFASCIYIMDKCKNKQIYILLILSLLMLNSSMFAQCYTWFAGSITYLYPSAIFIIYFTYLYYKIGEKFNFLELLALIIINICSTMFVENIGCSLVFGNFLFLIYSYLKDKEKFIPLLVATITSCITLIIMLKSPGSAIRSATNIEFNNLNIFQKIILNSSNVISFIFTRNSVMLILMLIVINHAIKKSNLKNKILIYTVSNIIPILAIIENVELLLPINISFLKFNIPKYLDVSNRLYIFYWIIFLLIYLYCIYTILKKQRKKMIFVLFLVISSIVSSLVMMILSTWGDRVTFLSTITITISSIILINEFIPSKIRLNKIINFSSVIIVSFYLICFVYVYKINNVREKYIYEQVNNGLTEIEVLENPIRLIWNNNLPGDYFVNTYRKYLNLDESVKLKTYKLRYREYFKILLKIK